MNNMRYLVVLVCMLAAISGLGIVTSNILSDEDLLASLSARSLQASVYGDRISINESRTNYEQYLINTTEENS